MTMCNLISPIRRHRMKFTQAIASKNRMANTFYRFKLAATRSPLLGFLVVLLVSIPSAAQQDWIRTGTGLGVEKVRLGVPDFKGANADPKNAELLKTFNDTLWNDLDNAG